MTLLDRIAAAKPEEQRELLMLGYDAAKGGPLFTTPDVSLQDMWEALLVGPGGARRASFLSMLDAGAYLDAVLLMMPENHFWSITKRGTNRDGYDACCQREGALKWCEGPTPALAVMLAILKAGGHDA